MMKMSLSLIIFFLIAVCILIAICDGIYPKPPVTESDNLKTGAWRNNSGVGVAIADMNVDGHLDIVSVSPNGVKYFESDGNGGYFDRGVIAETGTFLNCAGVDVAIADLDNNGVPDIVIAGPNGIRIFKNPIPQ